MRTLRDTLIVILACAAVFWPALGRDGFSMTEGHRVIPGWEMLDTGHWWRPTLFGQVYLRKPPGMSWAVGASAALFGKSEFSARAVSAAASTLSALLLLVFARRWFGPRYAAWAGVMFALTPLFWSPGRSAEIEALNNLGALASMLLTIDLFLAPRAGVGHAAALAAALILAGLAKGPAAGPCVLAAVIVASRGGAWRTRARWYFAALFVGLVVLAAAGWKLWAEARGQDPIMQSPSEFLWTSGRLSPATVASILLVPPAALVSALPTALVLPFALGRGAGDDPRARAAAWTVLIALTFYPLLGVANPRYAMPALTLIPVLIPWFLRNTADAWEGRTLSLARTVMLRVPLAWPIILGAGAMAYITVMEPSRHASSGREPGRALAASLPAGATVWANDLIEARPETLLYAVRAAAQAGRDVRVLWKPGLAAGQAPTPGTFAVLRTDPDATDLPALRAVPFDVVTTGSVHKYTFSLLRVPFSEPSPAR
ncbi:MAG: glycosyltransferase family 39 protein [Phycisphaerales bacterium]|nr:glycosyltransferase family 39 protein [Phycisphaerales bacterium]